MYGDTAVIRRRVHQLREQGADIRTRADQLVGRVEEVAWTGRAADALRERIRDRASHLREVAGRHETAADSLERHLGAVENGKHEIAVAERKIGSLLADGRAPAGLTPPATGHRDWLAVEIPGQ